VERAGRDHGRTANVRRENLGGGHPPRVIPSRRQKQVASPTPGSSRPEILLIQRERISKKMEEALRLMPRSSARTVIAAEPCRARGSALGRARNGTFQSLECRKPGLVVHGSHRATPGRHLRIVATRPYPDPTSQTKKRECPRPSQRSQIERRFSTTEEDNSHLCREYLGCTEKKFS
jgi:hypothetical protein